MRILSTIFGFTAVIIQKFISNAHRSLIKNGGRFNLQTCKITEVSRTNYVVNKKDYNIHYEYFSKENSDLGNREENIKPLLVFVHGGAWKTGNSRVHYQKNFIKLLLENGIDVISCNYRKDVWQSSLQDVIATFEHVHMNHGDRPIVFCGASAGGHLTIMSYFYSGFFKEKK